MIFDPKTLIYGVESGDPGSLVYVFFLLIFNEIGLPLPIVYESLLLFSGYKISRGYPGFLLTSVFGALGSAIGASLVFAFFYLFGEGLLHSKFLYKYHEKVKLVKKELLKREIMAVALARLTPGLVGLAGVAAGALRLNYFKFLVGVLASNLVWAAVMITAGYFFGETSQHFSGKIMAVISFGALIAFLFFFKKVLSRMKDFT